MKLGAIGLNDQSRLVAVIRECNEGSVKYPFNFDFTLIEKHRQIEAEFSTN